MVSGTALHRVGALIGLLSVGCQPPLAPGGAPDRSCIPDWPEECLGEGETTDGEPGTDYTCPGDPPLEDGQRHGYTCLPVPEDGVCPESDSVCVSDAFESRFLVDCRDCLRESVEVRCGPQPGIDGACCYRAVITSPDPDCE